MSLGCEVHFFLLKVGSLVFVDGRSRSSVDEVYQAYNTLFCVVLAEKWSNCLKRLIH
jgi:hypothetical protein